MIHKLKERFLRFMQGRYGMDELGKVLNTVTIIVLIVAIFTRGYLYPVAIALMVYMYFRIFSKNIPKRAAENQKFCNWRYNLAVKRNKRKQHREQKKIYRFFSCPMCKQKVRVPKGRGKICITCPKCKQEFVRRS